MPRFAAGSSNWCYDGKDRLARNLEFKFIYLRLYKTFHEDVSHDVTVRCNVIMSHIHHSFLKK